VGRRGRTRTQGDHAIGSGAKGCQDETRGCIHLKSVGSHLPFPIESLVAGCTEKK
jgi:hypothetical protein